MARIPDIMELLGAGGHGMDPGKLRQFLAGAGASGQHIQLGDYDAYLRRGMERPIRSGVTLKKPLDLASVQRRSLGKMGPEANERSTTFQPAKFRNPRGKFRELLALLESEAGKAGHDSVYVENILNQFLPDVLGSAGYQMAGKDLAGIPSMYKRLESPGFRRMTDR